MNFERRTFLLLISGSALIPLETYLLLCMADISTYLTDQHNEDTALYAASTRNSLAHSM